MKGGWIGVDFDGTLCQDVTCVEEVWQAGAPIPKMVATVKALLAEGADVRIFTARVAACGQRSDIALDDQQFADYQRRMIQDWCLEHLGVVLLVTATKDFQLAYFYDDKCREVVTNSGRTLREIVGEGLLKALRDTVELI